MPDGWIITGPTASYIEEGTDVWLIKIAGENHPPNPPTITGRINGRAGNPYTYTFSSIDPNGDQVSYYVDWGDETNTGWFGPFASGTPQTKSHTWSEPETYTITVKAKDTNGLESDWSYLEITMPRHKIAHNTLFQKWLEMFPLLERLLNLR